MKRRPPPRPRPQQHQQQQPEATSSGSVARWARRFRRLAAVVAFEGEPSWAALERLRDLRHGGIGIPRAALATLSPGSRGRFDERPFLVLDHPDEGLARIARASGPRAPAHLVEASVHALSHCAPLVLLDRKDAQAVHPLVAVTVAVPGDAVRQAVRQDFEAILRGGSAAVQDGYGQVEKAGRAVLDLARGAARERTLTSLLQRLTRARSAWAERDAERRFRGALDAARFDAEGRGIAKGEKDPLLVTQPVVLGYLDLLPLLLTKLGPGSDLLPAFERPLAQLALGVGVVSLLEA